MDHDNHDAGENDVTLELDDTFVAVRYKEPTPRSMRAEAAQRAGFESFGARFEIPNEHYTLIPVQRAPAPGGPALRASRVQALVGQADVARVAPVFLRGSTRLLATDRILVGFKPMQSANDLLQQLGAVLERDDEENEYLIELPESADPIRVAAELAKRPEISYAEPDLVTIGKHVARPATPALAARDDPFADRQYALELTRAPQAWALGLGDPAVRIAILDEGVDTMHEDLRAAVVGTFDAHDNDTFQEPNHWDGHGTACAGLAAAVHGNGRGIKGISAGCSILAVRIAQSPYPGGPWVTTTANIRRAIDWSWKNGAAVLSNSWGGGERSTAIMRAFERARCLGRGGKGCVIVVAAGNDSQSVDFPGNLPKVLTVSASNEYDEPKTKTSRDGEFWWGTNHGPFVDIAAPGVHHCTTDISGDGGYTRGGGPTADYVSNFNGTSSATPIVAGAVGLVLSANNDLTEAEAREIIQGSADKVGPLPYQEGRNDYMGAGRLNVLRAVQLALAAAQPLAAE